MRYIFLFLITTVLGACSTISESPDKKVLRLQMGKWVGHPVDDLVAVNGPPADIFMLESGGRVFEYVYKHEKQEAKPKLTETEVKFKSDGRMRRVPVLDRRGREALRERERAEMNMTAPEVPIAVGDLSWQMDHGSQYTQYSHREIPLGCNVLFSVSAGNIIERWSMEGEQCN